MITLNLHTYCTIATCSDDVLTVQEGETVELRVIREQGKLLNQLVRYTVIPSGNTQFYGATGILEFQPGEREVMVALVAKPDGIPEVRTLLQFE